MPESMEKPPGVMRLAGIVVPDSTIINAPLSEILPYPDRFYGEVSFL